MKKKIILNLTCFLKKSYANIIKIIYILIIFINSFDIHYAIFGNFRKMLRIHPIITLFTIITSFMVVSTWTF